MRNIAGTQVSDWHISDTKRDILDDLMQDGPGLSAYGVKDANKTYYDCPGR